MSNPQDNPSRWALKRRKRRAFEAGRESGGSDLSSASSSSSEREPPKRRRERRSAGDEDSSDETVQTSATDNEAGEEEEDEDGDEGEEEEDGDEGEEEDGETDEEQEEAVRDINIPSVEEELNAEDGFEDDAPHADVATHQNAGGGPAEVNNLVNHNDLFDVQSDSSDSNDSSSSSDDGSDLDSESESDTDSDSDEELIEERIGDGDEPLYENARISKMESIMMILTLALKFGLSGECLVHVLELIELHCPPVNRCVKTLYMFKKVFKDIGRNVLVLHYYCETCFKKLDSKRSICDQCNEETVVSFFIEVPFINQLQRLFLKPGFIQKLQYRFNRQKKHPDNIEDIYDGRLYQEQVANGFLQGISDISFMWYTDGISIFKSSKFSIWPLFFVINELNFKERTKRENVILAGLWFGKSKPKPNLFLGPFRETFRNLRNVGYQFNVPQGPPVTVRGLLLCGTCDLQAKGLMLRSKMSNGYYGCSQCVSPGERVPAGRTTVHVHRYIRPEDIQLRNNFDIPTLAAQKRMGYKGLSLLYVMMPSMVRGVGIDCMHMIFLGLSKLMTKLWFDSCFSGEPFSCSNMSDIVNERLASIKPPSFIQRLTRTLVDLNLWKAREYKLWFLYYSLVVMNGVLENVYLHHHVKLVSAIALLCSESISPAQIEAADALLHEYVRDFEALYTLRFMGMNVHLLLHLAEMVRDLGPLWVMSAFFLEDLNGQIVRLIHGPYQPGLQICSSASLFLSLGSKINNLPPDSISRRFCERLNTVGSKYSTAEVISEKLKIIGKRAFDCEVPEATAQILREQLNIDGHLQLFFSLRKDGVVFTSERRITSNKRCSMFACLIRNGVPCLAKIKEFVRSSDCQCVRICTCLPAKYFCIVQKYERIPWFVHNVPNSRINYLTAVRPTDNLLAYSCNEIKNICFYMLVDNVEYMACPVNCLEYE